MMQPQPQVVMVQPYQNGNGNGNGWTNEEVAFATRLYFVTHYKTRRGILGLGIIPTTCVTPRRVDDPALQVWERFIMYKMEQRMAPQ